MRAAVIGHVEWIDFVRVERMPAAGDIAHALEAWQEPGGGGSVAAARLSDLAGEATFFTALGEDDLGHAALAALRARGLRVEATFRQTTQRRGITFIDASGERSITVLGERLGPAVDDPLPWEVIDTADAVFLTACDAATVRRARRARVLVATPRMLPVLAEAGVALDALVGSASDPAEGYAPGGLDPPPRLVVRTEGARGGTFILDGRAHRYEPVPVLGPVADSYGCGDSFAAGLTYALGAGDEPADAVALAARAGAAALTVRGALARITVARAG